MSENRVAVVTGGAQGLGLAIAQALAKDGMAVVIGDVDEEGARRAAAAISAGGGYALGKRTDVAVAADANALVELAVKEFGRLDCAINNAGININPSPMADIDDQSWDRVMAVNLGGIRNCMRAEIAHMLGAGAGTIVNMGSTLGLVGTQNSAAYVTSKHAVVGLTRAAALDYAKAGIRINAVCPGPVLTAMANVHVANNAAALEQVRATVPIGRFIEAREVADAVAWLCSPASSGLFGHMLTIDGGWTAV